MEMAQSPSKPQAVKTAKRPSNPRGKCVKKLLANTGRMMGCCFHTSALLLRPVFCHKLATREETQVWLRRSRAKFLWLPVFPMSLQRIQIDVGEGIACAPKKGLL